MTTCEVSERCMAVAWYRVRTRYGQRPVVTLLIHTCRRHLSMAVTQALAKGTVTVARHG